MSERLSFRRAAERVLEDAGKPLHYTELTRRALRQGLITTEGVTPQASMNAQLSVAVKQEGNDCPFVRIEPGVFALRQWIEEGKIALAELSRHQVRVPHFPVYEKTQLILGVLDGVSRNVFLGLRNRISALRGTPQSTVDWSDPDTWIEQRLGGEDSDLAMRIWDNTNRKVNPRYTTGHWLLASNYGLLETNPQGLLVLTVRGREFVTDASGPVVREVDEAEGLVKILEVVAEVGPARRGALLEPWRQYLGRVSKVRSDAAAKERLWARLRNLRHRGLVERKGSAYESTDSGLAYLKQSGAVPGGSSEPEPEQELRDLLASQKRRVRGQIRDLIGAMDPIQFEHLVSDLLEAMGYEDVEVTAPVGDRGVDVVGRISVGITSVLEVVQVKHHTRRIQRKDLDALRGSLHRFRAVRGTIITTSDFAKGTREAALEPNAAPITLIDGEKLIDLLIEHDIGVSKRSVEFLEVDPGTFEEQVGVRDEAGEE